jgi:hypothetical protein
VQNGYELNEIHDVQIPSIANNDVIKYDSATSLWKNVNQSTLSVGTAVYATTSGSAVTITGSITKSQVSDFTSGTVASAGTAQQAGTAVYAVNSGTAIYATTSGTALTITGSITKSQVSDFTSGTVASATNAGTSVYATNSGTAVYATTSGTALTITGDITKSQVSDFTSGTVTSASTAQQSGTAVYAVNSGTAVSISGSIAQSQVTNLVTDLSAKANLAGGNTFTEAQTITGSVIGDKVLVVKGASGQTANLFEVQDSTGTFRVRINQVGNSTFAGNITSQNNALFTPFSAATIPLSVQGAASQSANLQEWRDSSGNILSRISQLGSFVTPVSGSFISGQTGQALFSVANPANIITVIRGAASQTANLLELQNSASSPIVFFTSGGRLVVGTDSSAMINATANAIGTVPLIVKGASGQTASLTQWQNSAGGLVATMSAAGDLALYGNGITSGDHRVGTATYLSATLNVQARAATEKGIVVRGFASQTANLQDWQESGGGIPTYVNSFGGLRVRAYANSFPFSALGVAAAAPTEIAVIVRGVANQLEDLTEYQNSAGTILGGVNANAQIYTGSTQAIQTAVGAGINGVSGNGTLVTFSTTNAHNLANGDRVTIAGLTPAGYNGTYIISGVSTFSFNVANTTTGVASGSGTVVVDAQASITARSAGTIPLIVRATSGQATNLFEARDSANNAAAWITSSGTFTSTQSTGFSIVGATFYGTLNSGQTARIQAGGSVGANAHVVVRGVAAATGNLQEWQSSGGSILASIDVNGMANLLRGNFRGAVYGTGIYYGAVNVLQESGGHGVTIQGRDSQTTDILRIRVGATPGAGNDAVLVQNSGGVALTKLQADGGASFAQGLATIGSGGIIRGAQTSTNSDLATMREENSGGLLRLTRQTASAANPAANQAKIYLVDGTTPGTLKLVVRAGAAGAETTILDNIPQ